MEWLYVNRLLAAVVSFVISLIILLEAHAITIEFQYTEPTSDYNLLGSMSASQEKKAMETTRKDNTILEQVENDLDITKDELKLIIRESEEFVGITEIEYETVTNRIWDKLQIIQSAYLKWFEVLISFVIMAVRLSSKTYTSVV